MLLQIDYCMSCSVISCAGEFSGGLLSILLNLFLNWFEIRIEEFLIWAFWKIKISQQSTSKMSFALMKLNKYNSEIRFRIYRDQRSAI